MNWIVYHIASGHSFFSGIVLIITAVLASAQSQPVLRRFGMLLFLIGVIAVVVSSTAIPYWIYAVAIATTFGWIVS